MTLYEELQTASSEEDVKDIHIRALGLKKGFYKKGWIDIQTEKVWFEAKMGCKISTYEMFTQLLYYVDDAICKSLPIPPFLCVIDTRKAALMETKHALPLLDKKIIKWGKNASNVTKDALDTVSQYIGTYIVSFSLETQEKEYLETVKRAIDTGEIVRTQITPNNLKTVFDQWVEMIGKELEGAYTDDYYLLFYADIMTDGERNTHEDLPAQLLHTGGRPTFFLNGKLYKVTNYDGYRRFWSVYSRPPKEEYRNYLLERRDTLYPTDVRIYKGDFYTPLNVVEKAYEYLDRTLGSGWQKDYIVWDMCCGVGNLETKHGNPRNIYMSTINQSDVDIIKSTRSCSAAVKFQYDYLNDDITDSGEIDYSLTNKVPLSLRKIIEESKKGKKKILVLINPPYAEATNADNTVNKSGSKKAENKIDVSHSIMNKQMDLGYAKRELFIQFLIRIAKEVPTATIAMFSTLKYVNAPNFEKFRHFWNAEFLDGFIIHSKVFDGLDGDFPIGFCIWKTNHLKNARCTPITEIVTEVYNKDVIAQGSKVFINIPKTKLLSNWVKRPKKNKVVVVPLKNAVIPSDCTKDLRGDCWSDNAICCFYCAGNDMQHAIKYTCILSSGYGSAGAYYINPDNLSKSAVIFTVRRIVEQIWICNRDQFLIPSVEISDEFYTDCLIWMLFNSSNLTASADVLEWNGKKWSIVNHFIPFTEDEVGSPDRFESDFMVQYLLDKHLSPEAQAVMDEGRKIWCEYFKHNYDYRTRDELKLNRCDVGWYQIRQALKAYNKTIDAIPFDFSCFERAYKTLTDKLRPKVYEYGFLK